MSASKKNTNNKSKLSKIIKDKIERIKLDNTSGSRELSKKAADILIFLVENVKNTNTSELINLIQYTTNELTKAQPIMASIVNLANSILLENIGLKKIDKIKQNINKSCQLFIQHLEISSKIISELTVKIIKDDTTVITHSYSSTLLNTLIFAKDLGKNFKIICTESRPMNEGLELARQLGKKGINVELMVDSAIFSIVLDADLILVGADALSSLGVVNKIGTHGLALAAKQYKKPIYVLCSMDKILPKEYPIIFKYEKNPNEIISKPIKNITPVNYYFDLTPLDFITGIITEKGILSPFEIQEHIKKLLLNKNLI